MDRLYRLLGLALVILLAACSSPEEKAREYLEQGQVLLQAVLPEVFVNAELRCPMDVVSCVNAELCRPMDVVRYVIAELWCPMDVVNLSMPSCAAQWM